MVVIGSQCEHLTMFLHSLQSMVPVVHSEQSNETIVDAMAPPMMIAPASTMRVVRFIARPLVSRGRTGYIGHPLCCSLRL